MKWLFAKEKGESSATVALLSFALLIIIFANMIGKGVSSYQYAHTESELTARVLDTETKVVDEKDHWFISVQPVVKVDGVYESAGEPEVLEVADSAVYSQRNSSDVYFEMKREIGAVYKFKLQGWRSAYWSEWRNIVGHTKVQDKGR